MAGGCGTRLYPTTKAVNKSLLPVYDKPMIYYQISLLMTAGVREILINISPGELHRYQALLGDGSRYGIQIRYAVENKPLGIIRALIDFREFINGEAFAMMLGDNIFLGQGLDRTVQLATEAFETCKGAEVFCRYVSNPRDFGVVEFDDHGGIRTLESKPQEPRSHYAVTGLFFFQPEIVDVAKKVRDTEGRFMELSELLKYCLTLGQLHSVILDEDIQWFDAGTPQRMFEAAAAVKAYQEKYKKYAGCIEEIAFDHGLIGSERLAALSSGLLNTDYGRHISMLAAQGMTL